MDKFSIKKQKEINALRNQDESDMPEAPTSQQKLELIYTNKKMSADDILKMLQMAYVEAKQKFVNPSYSSKEELIEIIFAIYKEVRATQKNSHLEIAIAKVLANALNLKPIRITKDMDNGSKEVRLQYHPRLYSLTPYFADAINQGYPIDFIMDKRNQLKKELHDLAHAVNTHASDDKDSPNDNVVTPTTDQPQLTAYVSDSDEDSEVKTPIDDSALNTIEIVEDDYLQSTFLADIFAHSDETSEIKNADAAISAKSNDSPRTMRLKNYVAPHFELPTAKLNHVVVEAKLVSAVTTPQVTTSSVADLISIFDPAKQKKEEKSLPPIEDIRMTISAYTATVDDYATRIADQKVSQANLNRALAKFEEYGIFDYEENRPFDNAIFNNTVIAEQTKPDYADCFAAACLYYLKENQKQSLQSLPFLTLVMPVLAKHPEFSMEIAFGLVLLLPSDDSIFNFSILAAMLAKDGKHAMDIAYSIKNYFSSELQEILISLSDQRRHLICKLISQHPEHFSIYAQKSIGSAMLNFLVRKEMLTINVLSSLIHHPDNFVTCYEKIKTLNTADQTEANLLRLIKNQNTQLVSTVSIPDGFGFFNQNNQEVAADMTQSTTSKTVNFTN